MRVFIEHGARLAPRRPAALFIEQRVDPFASSRAAAALVAIADFAFSQRGLREFQAIDEKIRRAVSLVGGAQIAADENSPGRAALGVKVDAAFTDLFAVDEQPDLSGLARGPG
jgi:hypothetical protein